MVCVMKESNIKYSAVRLPEEVVGELKLLRLSVSALRGHNVSFATLMTEMIACYKEGNGDISSAYDIVSGNSHEGVEADGR